MPNYWLSPNKLLIIFKSPQSRQAPFIDASIFTVLLFAAHPIHCEAVAGIVGRADVLAAIVVLAGILAFGRKEVLAHLLIYWSISDAQRIFCRMFYWRRFSLQWLHVSRSLASCYFRWRPFLWCSIRKRYSDAFSGLSSFHTLSRSFHPPLRGLVLAQGEVLNGQWS